MTLMAVALLAAGTYGLRLCGPVLRARTEISARTEQLLADAATVLLCALVATSALMEGQGPAGWARPAGVLAGAALAWCRAPFLVTVLGAAAVTAGLRWAGVT
ncbi:AzlD domain-containing protein [Streptomyces sp. CA-250714]|uniref:AzlD domain-containing protein n=1 Tax=Streptomyces sp. CA-250714 TaxID=3240060 RepID=UPI003D94C18C